jgi:opacity protein-like surface antigen
MKKIFIAAGLMVLIGTNVQAQDQTPGVMGSPSFGIYGGVNFQNINGKDAGGKDLKNSLVTKYHFGINYEIPLAPDFYFAPGLQITAKGTEGPVTYTDNTSTRTINRELSLTYLEVPLNLVFKPLVGNGHFILGFGPYLGYALAGKAKFDGDGAPGETDLVFGKTANANDVNNLVYFKKMDIGANAFFGYQFMSGLNFIFNAQLGLVNINSDTNTDLANKNTGFGISAGYRF